jgi:hypothetical protein
MSSSKINTNIPWTTNIFGVCVCLDLDLDLGLGLGLCSLVASASLSHSILRRRHRDRLRPNRCDLRWRRDDEESLLLRDS